MDAVEFLKEWKRMCGKYEGNVCLECPFDNENELCSFYTDDEEEVVRKVEEWYKQRPKFELTEQQITAIKGRIAEGYFWVARSEGGKIVDFFDNKPMKSPVCAGNFIRNILDGGTQHSYSMSEIFDFVTFENSPINLIELLREVE